MVFDFDIIYIKGNTIPHINMLSRLHFKNETKEKQEKVEDKIIP